MDRNFDIFTAEHMKNEFGCFPAVADILGRGEVSKMI